MICRSTSAKRKRGKYLFVCLLHFVSGSSIGRAAKGDRPQSPFQGISATLARWIDDPGQDEQQVAEAVEVDDQGRRARRRPGWRASLHDQPLGAAADRPGQVDLARPAAIRRAG